MPRTIRDIVLELLVLSNYPHDKDTFIAKFEELNNLEALVNCVNKLPKDIQEKINTSDQAEKEILNHVSKETYQHELTNVSHHALGEFIETLLPTLSEEQKEKVAQLIQH